MSKSNNEIALEVLKRAFIDRDPTVVSHELVVVELGHTDTDYTTCLYVPSTGLVVAGDAAYNDVHLYLVESNAQKRQEWIAALDKIESLKSPTTRCWSSIRPGSILGGRSGVRHVRSSHENGLWR